MQATRWRNRVDRPESGRQPCRYFTCARVLSDLPFSAVVFSSFFLSRAPFPVPHVPTLVFPPSLCHSPLPDAETTG